jgi:hypothetical protein
MQPENQQTTSQELYKNIDNPLLAMQPGEVVICVIKRHPIGLIQNYVTAGTVIVLAALGAFVIVPMYAPEDIRNQALGWAVVGLIFLAFFVFVFSYIAAKVYKGNRWIVTSDSITQIRQNSLFSKQSSQLSLHNLEDITVNQNGLVQTGFNYGTLHAETAGERSKFVFPYTPNPNQCAREILMAREKFMGGGAYEGKANTNASLPPHDQGPTDQTNSGDSGAGLNIGN